MEAIKNYYLRLRYNHFPPRKPDMPTPGRVIFRSDKANDFKGLIIKDNEFYNENDVYFSASCVKRSSGRNLLIDIYYDPMQRETWQGKRWTNYTSGMVETLPITAKGLWIIEARVPKLWPAIWLLHEKHVNEDGIETITPEIDIMEVIRGEFQHTIHYKPTLNKYSTNGCNNDVRYDNEWHTFAVNVLDNGYDFYIDGILTGTFRNRPGFTSTAKKYLVINNAITTDQNLSILPIRNQLFIHSITVHEQES